MQIKSKFSIKLSSFGLGSPCSYKLEGDHISGKFLGFIPAGNIHLENVNYLRLATSDEAPPLYVFFNYIQFMSFRRARRPVYVLQTQSRRRIFLKLDSGTHFRLRQAIGRYVSREKRMAA
ncbi:MAG TPA: hypothetical protein VLL07_03615 [Pontiella sp.]|nr:hypothetical protein [Pontiella sp.]